MMFSEWWESPDERRGRTEGGIGRRGKSMEVSSGGPIGSVNRQGNGKANIWGDEKEGDHEAQDENWTKITNTN